LTTEEKQRALSCYRIQQADESLEEAMFLFDGRKSTRAVINRAYYAMFYSVLALLVYEPFSTSKHTGIISYFNKRFIKGGTFSEEIGRYLNKAFEIRQREDYREYSSLSYEDAEPFLKYAEIFVNAVRDFLKDK